ncbi:PfkB family carbohydrate kinase [Halopiger djelfimassiliensis]|uniref:PfkB family carbohydrate kinase n=1 Tax=Halopiger djelfimassiliensis TaxID=1293047 RepID=UPI000677E362|nr:PfkB family carbohydrate kinase [Halopiger djelfimassiliensis]
MSEVVSLGSSNVDRIQYLPAERIRELENRHGWFPAAGETVRIDGVTDGTVLEGRSYRNVVGGKGANQAVAAARASAETSLLGCVGADEAEYGVLETLSERGVDVDRVAITDRETGKAYVFVDDDGESWIAIVGGANDAVDEAYLDRQYDRIRTADVLLLQNEIPRATMDRLLGRLEREAIRPTVVFNPAPVGGAAPLLDRSAIDFVVVNETEYRALEDRLAAVDGTVVRTRGGDDVIVTGSVTHRATPPTVDPVDTTGAGDAFCGYFGAALADGAAVEHAVDVATVAASIATEREGAQSAIPPAERVFGVLEGGASSF